MKLPNFSSCRFVTDIKLGVHKSAPKLGDISDINQDFIDDMLKNLKVNYDTF